MGLIILYNLPVKRIDKTEQMFYSDNRTDVLNEENEEGKMKNINRGGFITVVLLLTLIAVYCSAGTVMSRTDLSAQELEGFYREKEEGLVDEVREFLNGEGFPNSGVMLTRVTDADGSREYTLTVHHGKIDRLDEENRLLLMEQLEKMVFEDEDCTFRHEFLINQ